jgi:dephospho-CoA kinase
MAVSGRIEPMQRKPIIGLAGGIGSGKSFVASLFAELGWLVIGSDDLVGQVYEDPQVRSVLRQWWGDEVFRPDGEVDRRAIAAKVFADPAQRQRLEQLLHPKIEEFRQELMLKADPGVVGYVFDTPLLFETGLNRKCDVVVFVDAPLEQRVKRVSVARGWSREELLRREKTQMPLDKKRKMSDHVIGNTADAANARRQVRDVLSRICA